MDSLDGPFMNGFDVLQVGIPAFIGFIVGMANVMPNLVAFTANATYLGHGCSFQSNKNIVLLVTNLFSSYTLATFPSFPNVFIGNPGFSRK
jgi:hypothetical protein